LKRLQGAKKIQEESRLQVTLSGGKGIVGATWGMKMPWFEHQHVQTNSRRGGQFKEIWDGCENKGLDAARFHLLTIIKIVAAQQNGLGREDVWGGGGGGRK